MDDFSNFINELANAEQPTCNFENPEDCENCGSQSVTIVNPFEVRLVFAVAPAPDGGAAGV